MTDNALMTSTDAPLPETYQAAQRALTECSRIDECRQWANKAQAMASYARQAKDTTLHNLALRIQSRAMRRAGELLKQIPDVNRGRPSKEIQDAAVPNITRKSAASDAGLSERQRKTAIRVASVPAPTFEAAVESATPPTITTMAALGIEHREQPVSAPTTPDHAGASIVLAQLREMAVLCSERDPVAVAVGTSDPDIARSFVQTIDRWLDRFVTNLADPADDSEDAA